MPSESQLRRSDFLTAAVKLGLIAPATADELAREAESKEVDAERLVRQKGLLNSVQIDIVETLLRPREIAPGYEVLAVLGQGGMGVVYRARQLNLQRVVALKTVQMTQLADAKALARFEQEAQAVARLQHPHIVSAYDFGRHEGRLYFAMELVEGENASNFVSTRGPLSEGLAWQLGRQAAAGLAHAASLGIVHRDVKPANMLLVERPDGYLLPPGVPLLKLADFGLAQLGQEAEANNRLTTTGMAVGSPHYMSPEQLSGERVDLRSDIYSLGASIFQLIAGVPPFDGHTLPKLISAKLAAGAPSIRDLRPEVTPASAELLAAMMARDPSERPASYGDLIARIDALGALPGPLDATAPIRSVRSSPQAKTETGLDPTALLPKSSPLVETQSTAIPTENVTATGRSPTWVQHSMTWIVGGAIGLLLVALGVWFFLFGSHNAGPIGPRDLKPDGPMTVLFWGAGSTIGLPRSAACGTSAATKRVQESSSARAVPNGDRFPPDEHYRLNAAITLVDAQAAELHFGLPASPEMPCCGVLRISPGGEELLLCDARNTRRQVALRPRSVPSPTRTRDVHIERQSADWWVFVDNELVGTIPLTATGDRPSVQFQAEGGAVRFSDLSVQRLAAEK